MDVRLVEEIEYRHRLASAAEALGHQLGPLERSSEKLIAAADRSVREQQKSQSILSGILATSNLQLNQLDAISRRLSDISTTLDSMLDVLRHPRRTEGLELRDLGMKAMRRGKLRLARESFTDSIAQYRHDPVAHFWLGETLVGLGEPDLAIAEFELSIEYSIDDNLEPLVAGAALRACVIARAEGDGAHGQRILESAIEQIRPLRCPQLHLAMATITSDPNDLTTAIVDDPMLILDAEAAGLTCADQAARSACATWDLRSEKIVKSARHEADLLLHQFGVRLPPLNIPDPPTEPCRRLLTSIEVIAKANDYLDSAAQAPVDVPDAVEIPNAPPISAAWGCLIGIPALVVCSIVAPSIAVLLGVKIPRSGPTPPALLIAVISLAAIISIGAVGLLRGLQRRRKARAVRSVEHRSHFVSDLSQTRQRLVGTRFAIRSTDLIVPW